MHAHAKTFMVIHTYIKKSVIVILNCQRFPNFLFITCRFISMKNINFRTSVTTSFKIVLMWCFRHTLFHDINA